MFRATPQGATRRSLGEEGVGPPPPGPLLDGKPRSFKTVDLKVRPIHHRLAERVRAHVFLCMLAFYVEWHMRRALAPLLFDDDDSRPRARSAPPSSRRRNDPIVY